MEAVRQKHPNLCIHIPKDKRARITSYVNHIAKRPDIRVDRDAVERRISKYAKKKSKTSQHVAKLFQGMLNEFSFSDGSWWHRPNVSPFHTKTGRDTSLGPALNYVPKEYWPSILLPPPRFSYALLDYEQQEPLISAHLAGCETLLEWYQAGDIYEQVAHLLDDPRLGRPQTKTLLIALLYGISKQTLAEKLGVTISVVTGWMREVERVTYPIGPYLNRVGRTIQKNKVATSLSWRYAIDKKDSFNSLRNWSIQATGADIMRRACLEFDAAHIPLLLTNHDSFLIQVKTSNIKQELEKAKEILEVASSEVLRGFKLKAKVEMILRNKTNE
ncbi:DNA polymerase [Vibrio sp. B1FLJ16]|uniref:DNA polymerase n=1 Tax=Vibrio sp. B1FLJ16 TaxID=2751178 RepID=UPI0015F743B5|nr:DNA polymerase [Vibrio sp. B1FLJ16]CAD7798515.1 DNA polymerase family A [Vibrio sp. B1FLJ16]CAE6883902.1 DNA polymerase family A [Vibrio sp. B1FLJ16]